LRHPDLEGRERCCYLKVAKGNVARQGAGNRALSHPMRKMKNDSLWLATSAHYIVMEVIVFEARKPRAKIIQRMEVVVCEILPPSKS
jgi:hypothetical protein